MQHSDTDEHSASESTRLLDNYDMSTAFVESRREDEAIYENAAEPPTRDYFGLVSWEGELEMSEPVYLNVDLSVIMKKGI